ncbi:MAG: MFS transporter [Acidobacteria bacterium]|nr:MFS transporter [Acidobacteriota bacterium]
MAASLTPPRAALAATSGIVLVHMDFLVTGVVMTFLGPMLPQLSARWSLNDAGAGTLIFAQFFSSMFGMLLSGVLVGRVGYRLTFIIGLLLMASGMAGLASGPWLEGIAAVCTLGVGYGITTPAGNLRTAEVSAGRSASALNVINAVWGVGAMSSPVFVAAALRIHRPSRFLYGTAAALMALMIAMARSRFRPDLHAQIPSRSGETALYRSPMVFLISFLFFVYVGTETCFGQWVATYARRVGTGPHWVAALTPTFFYGALLLGRLLAPVALKVSSVSTLARAGLVTAALGGVCLMAAEGTALIAAGAFLAGLGLASIFPISVSLLPHWFGDSTRQASSPVFASGNAGGAVLPWLLGVASTHYLGLRLAFSIPLVGSIAMLVFYIAATSSRARPNPPAGDS